MINSSGGIPPGGGSSSEPPQGPTPPDESSPDAAIQGDDGSGGTHKWGSMVLDSKQWRMFNMLLMQQFQSVMKPLWEKSRQALKRLGKDDPYASG